MNYPKLVSQATQRVQSGEAFHSATGWVWSMADSNDRLAVDDWIVATKHPLGQLPSTRERRFTLLVHEAFAAT
jgi:hypothetical protein